MAGEKFSRWMVLEDSGTKNKYGYVLYLCRCDCGNERLVQSSLLIRGGSKSCGCLANDLRESQKRKTKYKRPKSRRKVINKIWNKLVKYIKLRDGNQCYICNSKEDLEIHHLNGWFNSELERYEETNLISLCNFCHSDYHSKYGKETTVKEEFISYISGFEEEEVFLYRLNKYKQDFGFDKGCSGDTAS